MQHVAGPVEARARSCGARLSATTFHAGEGARSCISLPSGGGGSPCISLPLGGEGRGGGDPPAGGSPRYDRAPGSVLFQPRPRPCAARSTGGPGPPVDRRPQPLQPRSHAAAALASGVLEHDSWPRAAPRTSGDPTECRTPRRSARAPSAPGGGRSPKRAPSFGGCGRSEPRCRRAWRRTSRTVDALDPHCGQDLVCR